MEDKIAELLLKQLEDRVEHLEEKIKYLEVALKDNAIVPRIRNQLGVNKIEKSI